MLNKESKVLAIEEAAVNVERRRVLEENRRIREVENRAIMGNNMRLQREINMIKTNCL